MWIPGLFTTTFYLSSRVVRQFGFLQDVLEDNSSDVLRGLVLRPSTIIAITTAWHERIVAPFYRIPTSIISTEEYLLELQTKIDNER